MPEDKGNQKDIYEIDGRDLYLIKGTDAFRLYGWSDRNNSVQMIEARQDISFGNRYHKLVEKSYQVLEKDVKFHSQHIDEDEKPLGMIITQNIYKGHTIYVMRKMAHAFHMKADAKLVCRIKWPLAVAKPDKHWHELIKPELINQELDNEIG